MGTKHTTSLQFIERPDLFLAGQLSGVEGYVESAAMGLLAGINAARIVTGRAPVIPPPETALGSLINHLTQSDPKKFQPSNVNFGLFPAWQEKKKGVGKKIRGLERSQLALARLEEWRQSEDI